MPTGAYGHRCGMAFVELRSWRTTLKDLADNIADKAGFVGHTTTIDLGQTWPRRDSTRHYANNFASSILRNNNGKQFDVPLDNSRHLFILRRVTTGT